MTTLVDIKNAILTHFLTQSSFTLPDDLKSFKIDPKDGSPAFAESKEEVARWVLDEYVKGGIVAKVSDTLYVLTQPISQLSQQVVITPLTALMLTNIVNDWVNATGERKQTGYVVNQLSINDRDVAALCHICHQLMDGPGPDLDDGEDPEKLPPGQHGNN